MRYSKIAPPTETKREERHSDTSLEKTPRRSESLVSALEMTAVRAEMDVNTPKQRSCDLAAPGAYGKLGSGLRTWADREDS